MENQALHRLTLPVAWLLPAIALIGVNTCLVVSIATTTITPTLPYLDGAVSISAASREPPAQYIFRLMASLTIVCGTFWWFQAGRVLYRSRWLITILGLLGVLGFLVYAVALGASDHQLTRRTAVYTFLACTIAAQVGLARSLRYQNPTLAGPRFLQGYAYALPILCLSLLPLGHWLLDDWDRAENFAEWHTLWLIMSYFPCAGLVLHQVAFNSGPQRL